MLIDVQPHFLAITLTRYYHANIKVTASRYIMLREICSKWKSTARRDSDMSYSPIGDYILKNLPAIDERAHIVPNIPAKILANAAHHIAGGISPRLVLGVYDDTLFRHARNGFVFTEDTFYVRAIADVSQKYSYTDLSDVCYLNGKMLINDGKGKVLVSHQFWSENPSLKNSMLNFFEGLVELANNPDSSQKESDEQAMLKIPTNCIGCGAGYAQAINAGARCEWCDTPY